MLMYVCVCTYEHIILKGHIMLGIMPVHRSCTRIYNLDDDWVYMPTIHPPDVSASSSSRSTNTLEQRKDQGSKWVGKQKEGIVQ